MDHEDDSKVARLTKELEKLARGRGLLEVGRLSKCTLLIEAASKICHPKGEKGEPLLDAMRVLTDAAHKLPEDYIRIFHTMFALGEGNWSTELMERRYDLARDLKADYKTIYRRGKEILSTVAYSIVEREQQAVLAEAESQSEKPTSPADILVSNVEATIVLNDDGRPIGRETSVTLQVLRPLTDPRTAALEFNNGEFRIDNTVNCTVLDPREYLNQLESMLAEQSHKENEDLRHTQNLGKSLSNLLENQQWLRQSLENMNTLLGLPDVFAIDLPPQEAGESLTFSYSTSYIHPLDKDTGVSRVSPMGSTAYVMFYSHDPRGFSIGTSLPLPRVKLRIKADQPLKVVPHLDAPGNPQFSSMAVIPFGYPNIIKRASDGSYEHTFHDLPPESVALLMWSVE